MKSKIVWSVAALLAGTSFAAAQNVNVSNGTVGSNGTVFTQEVANCNNGCSSFGNDYRIYGRAEALVWALGTNLNNSGLDGLPGFRQSMPYAFGTAAYDLTNPLVPVQLPGIDGARNVSGLVQLDPSFQTGSGLNGLDRLGARFTLGMALDTNHDWAAEVSYFQLESKTVGYRGTASANNVSFTNGLNDVVIVTTVSGDPPLPVNTVTQIPVVFDADIAAVVEGTSSSRLFGLEANVTHRSFTIGRTRFSEIYGLRYLDLTVDQSLAQSITFFDSRYIVDPITGAQGQSTTVLLGDYSAHNQFYGAQVGAKFESDFGRFFVNGFGKFGFGTVRQDLSANEVVFNVDGADVPFTVYPSPTNTRESRNRVAYILEGNLTAGFYLTDNLSISAGYNILAMTRMARPAGSSLPSQGNGRVSFGTEDNPVPLTSIFSESRYFAHGLTLGLELRY
jgi:hypothetical protein